MAAVDDAVSDGLFYGRKDGAWAQVTDFGPEDVLGGQGISVVLPGDGTVEVHSTQVTGAKVIWLWNTAVSGDPGNGYMLGDTASGSTVTSFNLSIADKDGNDVSGVIATMKTGDQLQILRDNAGTPEYSVWSVDADPVDQTTYYSVPVTLIFESSTDSPSQDDEMNVQWTPQDEQLPPLPHQHDHNTDLTNVGTNTHAAIDTHIASTANPHAVTWDQLGGTQPPPAAHNLGSHSDVTLTTPADQHALIYDGASGDWINQALPSGVTSHGALTGLDADDHLQYLNVTRHGTTDHDLDQGTF
jgi:hypothetical protein